MREPHRARQPVLTGIEELIHQILGLYSRFPPAWDIAGLAKPALKVIGAYPPGQSHFTMKRKGQAVPRVRLPDTDPFYGPAGPLTRCWTK
jgi:hypothetical protein